MTREEIFQKVLASIKITLPEVDSSTINLATHLRNDLGADSVDSLSLIMVLEEQFGAPIPVEKATGITTVGQILDVIEGALKLVPHPETVCI